MKALQGNSLFKTQSRRVLAILLLVAVVHLFSGSVAKSQHSQPTPPPDTSFPLGGWVYGISGDAVSKLNTYWPFFGLNCIASGPTGLKPGMSSLRSGEGGDLSYFVPNGTFDLGWNPIVCQGDFRLVSNESGSLAWDMVSNWGRCSSAKASDLSGNNEYHIEPSSFFSVNSSNYYLWGFNSASEYDANKLYQPGQWVTHGTDGCVYVCLRENSAANPHAPQSCSKDDYWGHIDSWQSGSYSSKDGEVRVTHSDGSPFKVWRCTNTTSGTTEEPSINSLNWVPSFPIEIGTFLGKANGGHKQVSTSSEPPPFEHTPAFFYIDLIARIDKSSYPADQFNVSSTNPNPDDIYRLEISVLWDDRTNNLKCHTFDGAQHTENEHTQNGSLQTPLLLGIKAQDLEYTSDGGWFAQLAGENSNILNFPNTELSPPTKHYDQKKYCVFRVKVMTDGVHLPLGIVLNLKAATSNGIYVRGVRIRSDYADDFFRGEFDNSGTASDGLKLPQLVSHINDEDVKIDVGGGLKSVFGFIRSKDVGVDGKSFWNKVLGIGIGNEPNWPSFRAFAHINELLRAWSKLPQNGRKEKNLSTILGLGGHNLGWFRPIYEDQGGTPPPIMQNESGLDVSGTMPWGSPEAYTAHVAGNNYFGKPDLNGNRPYPGVPGLLFPGDAIPSAIKNHANFNELERDITGWQGKSSITISNPDGIWLSTTISGDDLWDDYEHYTAYFQNNCGNADNDISAKACYPQDKSPSTWTSYYSYPLAMEGGMGWPWAPYSLEVCTSSNVRQTQLRQVQSHIFDAIYRGLIQGSQNVPGGYGVNPGDEAASAIFTPEDIAIINAPFEIAPGDYRIGGLNSGYHALTPWEIREQTWDAITWGAKGLMFNYVGSDGRSNVGFCGNNFSDNVNSGFSDLYTNSLFQHVEAGEGQLESYPPNNTTLDWNDRLAYGQGDWVKYHNPITTTDETWVCVSNVGARKPTEQSNTPPSSTNSNWAHSYRDSYYAVNMEPGTGYIIPVATPSSGSSVAWVDHVITSGSNEFAWIPCLSDFDIYDGPKSTGTLLWRVGDPITHDRIMQYLTAVEHYDHSNENQSWAIPNDKSNLDTITRSDALKNYYSDRCPPKTVSITAISESTTGKPHDVTVSAAGFLKDQFVSITGVTPADYNGFFRITDANATSFHYYNTTTGLSDGTSFGAATLKWVPMGDFKIPEHPDLDNRDFNTSGTNGYHCWTLGNPKWSNDATHPGQYFSDWLAGYRDLDNAWYDWTRPRWYNKPDAVDHHFSHGYDGWWSMPLRYPHPPDPNPAATFYLSDVPSYYGVKDRSDGVKRSTADIAPIANELKRLQWITAFNYADFKDPANAERNAWAVGNNEQDKQSSGEPVFPFTIEHSYWVSQQKQINGFSSNTLPYTVTSDAKEDDDKKRFYNIGVFHDQDDPDAVYVAIANRRTWPVLYNEAGTEVKTKDDTHTNTDYQYDYLGGIDVRLLDLKLKQSWKDAAGHAVTWSSSGKSLYSISDLRGKPILHSTDNGTTWIGDQEIVDQTATPTTLRLELDPGEGTLLRIAPAIGSVLGRTSFGGYNNAHRIAEVRAQQHLMLCPNGNSATSRGVCWEQNGRIMFSLANPAGSGDPSFLHSTPVQIYPANNATPPINHSEDGHNPSIASKPLNEPVAQNAPVGDTIAIVFSIDNFGNPNSQGAIRFAWGVPPYDASHWTLESTPIATPNHTAGGVADVTGGGGDLFVPCLTPGRDGFVGVYTQFTRAQPFWIRLRGITPVWTTKKFSDLSIPLDDPEYTMFAANAQVRFATVASNADHVQANPEPEMWHFAWEGDFGDGSSAIYHRAIKHDPTLSDPDRCVSGLISQVSQGYPVTDYTVRTGKNGETEPATQAPVCLHRHPMITAFHPPTVGGFSMPAITWEVTDQFIVWSVIGTGSNARSVLMPVTGRTKPVVREATNMLNNSPFKVTWGSFLSVAADYDKNLPQPVLRVESNLCQTDPSALDQAQRELVFQDTFAHDVKVYRGPDAFGTTSNNFKTVWTANRLLDQGQTPSVSLPYEAVHSSQHDLGSIEYAGVTADLDRLYSIKLVANPPGHKALKKNLIQYLDVKWANAAACKPPVVKLGVLPVSLIRNVGDSVERGQLFWFPASVGAFSGVPVSDSVENVKQDYWPKTEDTIVSNYFQTNDQTIEVRRLLAVDSAQLQDLLPDASHSVLYKLVVKDSASGLINQVLDSAVWIGSTQSSGAIPGVNPSDTTLNGVARHITIPLATTASGSAYLTLIVSKDTATQAELIQNQELGDELSIPIIIVDSEGGGAYKGNEQSTKTHIERDGMAVRVHPNPATNHILICVDEIPKDNPFFAEVVDATGGRIATIYDATPEADLGICYRLDCSQLAAGTYYVRVANAIQGSVTKFQVVK